MTKDRFNNAVGPQVRAEKEGPGKVIPALAVAQLLLERDHP